MKNTSTGQYSGSIASANSRIGNDYVTGYPVDGRVGQVRVYGSALNLSQIRQNFNFTKNDYPNGFNGAITGASFLPSDVSFDFDGNDFVSVGDFPSGAELTLSIWVNPESSQVAYSNIIDYEHANDGGWVIQQNNTTNNQYYFALKDGSSYDGSSSYFTPTHSTWTHYVFTVDSAGNHVRYKNGTSEHTDTGWGGLNAGTKHHLNIGCWGGSNGTTRSRFFKGKISDVKIFDKTLTQAEVTAQYNIGYNGIG